MIGGWGTCYKIVLMNVTEGYWQVNIEMRSWFGAVRQQTITWGNVDQDLTFWATMS